MVEFLIVNQLVISSIIIFSISVGVLYLINGRVPDCKSPSYKFYSYFLYCKYAEFKRASQRDMMKKCSNFKL